MAGPHRDEVLTALRTVTTPAGDQDIVSANLVSGIAIEGDQVRLSLAVDPAWGTALEGLRQAAETAVRGVPGVAAVQVLMTAEKRGPEAPRGKAAAASPASQGPQSVPGIGQIVVVASGKGGVGKSTVAANLAVALAAMGQRVGLLDADIYGPSMPLMTGLSGQPELIKRDGQKRIGPLEAYGLKVMSMGFLVDQDRAMIWRGPMVQTAVTQLFRDVEWAPLDILVVDMPPGTGDAQLTLAQKIAVTGAVIVSTPQPVALADARKGIAMFRRTDVPVLGMVENMAYFIAPDTGQHYDIFGTGGAQAVARELGVPDLGAIPLTIPARQAADRGQPVVLAAPDDPAAQAFQSLAQAVTRALAES